MEEVVKSGRAKVALHWIAVGFISFCLLGICIVKAEVWTWCWLNKSTRLLIFLIILARSWWRLIEGWPNPTNRYDAVEQKISKCLHLSLLIGTIFIPISGMIYSRAGGHEFGIFAWHMLAHNPALNPQDSLAAYSGLGMTFGALTYKWVAYSLLGLIALHTASAFKHHFIDKGLNK